MIPDAKGTTCNQRLEKVSGTGHTYILRVPFRTKNGILRKWISRFDVWPYLETFAEVSTRKGLNFDLFKVKQVYIFPHLHFIIHLVLGLVVMASLSEKV